MLSLIAVLVIVCTHFVADFVLQTHEQAINKSKCNRALAEHVFTYSLLFWLVFGWKFALVTAIAHFAVDWNTSRITSMLWKLAMDKEPNASHFFFVVIGFDQVLHLAQLLLTLLWLNGTALAL